MNKLKGRPKGPPSERFVMFILPELKRDLERVALKTGRTQRDIVEEALSRLIYGKDIREGKS